MDDFLPKLISTLPNPQASLQSVILSLPSLLSSSGSSSPCPFLKPKAFFPAFHGALTLAFDGWPRSVCVAKSCVDAAHAQTQCTHTQTDACALRAENAGTKWPKVTLGVLGEGVKLSEEDGKRLLQVVNRLNVELLQDLGDDVGEQLDVMDIVLYNVCILYFHLFFFVYFIFAFRSSYFSFSLFVSLEKITTNSKTSKLQSQFSQRR